MNEMLPIRPAASRPRRYRASMRTRIPLVALTVVPLVTAAAGPAWPITHAAADGEHQPDVRALIPPAVFVTAAHCGDPGQTTARVSFAGHYQAGSKLYVGQYVPDPRYRGAQSDPYDIAVVVFAAPVAGITPARLPAAGLLDRL